MSTLLRGLVFCGLMSLTTGCAHLSGSTPHPVPITAMNPVAASAKKIPIRLNRQAYKQALSNQMAQKNLRLVELLYGQDGNPGYREFRVFGVHKGGAFAMLGFENADVVLAADNFILNGPSKVSQYATLLADLPRGSFSVRRAGELLHLEYSFSE